MDEFENDDDYFEDCEFDKGAANKCLKGMKIRLHADCDDYEDACDKAEDLLEACADVLTDCDDNIDTSGSYSSSPSSYSSK